MKKPGANVAEATDGQQTAPAGPSPQTGGPSPCPSPQTGGIVAGDVPEPPEGFFGSQFWSSD